MEPIYEVSEEKLAEWKENALKRTVDGKVGQELRNSLDNLLDSLGVTGIDLSTKGISEEDLVRRYNLAGYPFVVLKSSKFEEYAHLLFVQPSGLKGQALDYKLVAVSRSLVARNHEELAVLRQFSERLDANKKAVDPPYPLERSFERERRIRIEYPLNAEILDNSRLNILHPEQIVKNLLLVNAAYQAYKDYQGANDKKIRDIVEVLLEVTHES